MDIMRTAMAGDDYMADFYKSMIRICKLYLKHVSMNSNESSSTSPIQAILERLAAMEAHLANLPTSAPMDTSRTDLDDPAIVARPTLTDLHPPEEFMGEDFFRRPLDEVDRRQFLQAYPRNVLRQYDPPVTNSIKIGSLTTRFDGHLSNVQFRLSGVTRPIDSFLYDLFRNNSESVPAPVVKEFAICIHEMLADVASHITQLRSDNVCNDNGLPSVPLVPPQRDPGLLLDAPHIIEQTKLCQSLSDISSQSRPRSRKRNGSSKPLPSHDSDTQVPAPPAPSSSESPNPRPRQVFRKGPRYQPKA
ncbi:hypothetical protein V8B55DRAFT_1563415 [Mucor lusitanicus]